MSKIRLLILYSESFTIIGHFCPKPFGLFFNILISKKSINFFFNIILISRIFSEHDLAVLDYLSDYICCLYGVPGAYGVVTMPASVRDGINIFLEGFIPTENLRFREEVF